MRNLAFGAIGVAILVIVLATWKQAREERAFAAESATAAAEEAAPGSTGGLVSRRPKEPRTAGGEAAGAAATSGGLLEREGPARGARKAPDPAHEAAPAKSGNQGDEIAIWAPPSGPALEREVEAAAALFHMGPAPFHAWLSERPAQLEGDRRQLALAFAAARGGGNADWDEVRAKLAASADVRPAEVELLDVATGRGGSLAAAASGRRETALEIAMHMDLAWGMALDAAAARDYASAAVGLSNVLQDELSAPWEADRATLLELSKQLGEAQSFHRWSRKGEWPSVTITVEQGDSLVHVRKRFLAEHPERVMCTGLIDRANGVRGRYLQPGQELRIPLDEVNVLVDLSARWVLYRFGDEVAGAWEAGVGASETPTDTGEYVVGEKLDEPPWWKPGEEPIPYGDPRNELGSRWLGWDDELGPTSLGFHGTNDPSTVGYEVSEGCVRLLNEDVELLFEILPQGARVLVRP